MKNFLKKNQADILFIAPLVVITAIFHGINMFHFPYYENDEGVYVSQAWSLIISGKLAPYTYWYDHAPAGWIFIALWNILTGGVFAFGFSVNSGRVFMWLLHIFSSIFLFFIIKRLTNSRMIAGASGLFFSFSPLAIYFQRRVLLDNIMTFWVLASLFLIYYYRRKLRYILLSGIFFGIAILSKENAIFFIPVFLYIIFISVDKKHRSFAVVKWLVVTGLITSLYFLYALIKGEFFPTGMWFGGNSQHVSLLVTLRDQYSRPGGGILDMNKSTFWNSMRIWLREDPLIIYSGIFTTLVNFAIGIKHKTARIVSLLSLSMWAFLVRGGLVIEFYVIPLFPFLAANIAVSLWYMERFLIWLIKPRAGRFAAQTIIITVVILFAEFSLFFATKVRGGHNLFTSDQTTPQIEAVNWLLMRDTRTSFYVIDNYGYVDLQSKNHHNFKNAEWYWKVDKDPAIEAIIKRKPENIDYVALTPQMEHDITTVGLPLTLTAWHNAKPIASFWKDGWGVEYWATNYGSRILTSSWESYKKDFITGGRVSDPYNGGASTSEGESYALLRAVWMDDQNTFDAVWDWMQKHLQQSNSLFSWKWVGGDDDGSVIDQGTATDADEDTALALIFAYRKWGEPRYLREAGFIMNGIWDSETATYKERQYLTAGNWANKADEIVINPSYLSPATYKIFAQVDNTHSWLSLVDTSYKLLTDCSIAVMDKTKAVLPPEWCSIDKKSGKIRQPHIDSPRATEYGYNAFRVPWRVALDYQWNKDERAVQFLSRLSFLSDSFTTSGRLVAAYQHDGAVWEDYESVAAYAGDLGYFLVKNPDLAAKLYQDKILAKFYEDKDKSYWDDPKNYYSQNWAWFGTALYTNHLPNIYSTLAKQ